MPSTIPDVRSDGELLKRFLEARCYSAASELVKRHGPMVWGVCRRRVGQTSDAEDAFQAVWLVFARRAGSVHPPEALGRWLYGVAVNVAKKARAVALKRHRRELAITSDPIKLEKEEHSELSALIDEEVSRLPEKYRTVFILCELSDKSRREAGAALGWPEGTIATRLAKARSILASRLTRRGVSLPAGVFTTLTLAETLSAGVPRLLADQAVSVIRSSMEAHAIAPAIHSLGEASMHAMRMQPVLRTTAIMALVLSTGLGVLAAATWHKPLSLPTDKPPKVEPMAAAFLFGESIPKKREANEMPTTGIHAERIEWWVGNQDGGNLRKLDDPKTGRIKAIPVDRTVILKRDANSLTLLGPDGGDLTFSLKDGPLAEAAIHDSGQRTTFSFGPDRQSVWFANKAGELCRIDLETKKLTKFNITNVNQADSVQFSADGSRITYSKYRRPDDRKPGIFSIYVASIDGKAEEMITEATNIAGFGFLPDGRIGVVYPHYVHAFDLKTKKGDKISGKWESPYGIRNFGGFSPDGTTFHYDTGGPYMLKLYLYNIKTEKLTTIREELLESFQEMIWVRVPLP
ncbi:MAG: sigma-70 family RNA polymerase sigma factor [Gemmatales bacterium]